MGIGRISVRAGNKPERFMELEGLRGIAAIVVVIFHAILMFYPGFFYGSASYSSSVTQNIRFEDNLYANPIMGIFTGSFSVAIFFVLSGFVLSVAFFKKGDVDIIKRLAAKRYVRLMLPALASIIFAYIIIQLGLDVWREQVSGVTHSSWLAGLWLHSPDLWQAIVQGVHGIFVSGTSSYNPVLWTIKYELIGSFMIFGLALLFSDSKYRWVVYMSLLLAFIGSWYLGFIVGMLIADLYVNFKKRLHAIPSWILIGGIPVGVGLGAFPPTDLKGTLYQWILLPGMSQAQNVSFYLTFAATLIILATLLLPSLTMFFSRPSIAFLGKYTFALYLVHMPILFSVGAGVFVIMYPQLGFHGAAIGSTLISILAIIPATYLFERYIDMPSIKFSSTIADLYSGKRKYQMKVNKNSVDLSRVVSSMNAKLWNAVQKLF